MNFLKESLIPISIISNLNLNDINMSQAIICLNVRLEQCRQSHSWQPVYCIPAMGPNPVICTGLSQHKINGLLIYAMLIIGYQVVQTITCLGNKTYYLHSSLSNINFLMFHYFLSHGNAIPRIEMRIIKLTSFAYMLIQFYFLITLNLNFFKSRYLRSTLQFSLSLLLQLLYITFYY